jgi:RNA polymerase sigma-70 factor (ECF subfamily)
LEGLDDGRTEPDRRAQLFEELALPALDGLYAFACRLERDPARAADLLQEALLTGFRKFSQLGSRPSFRSWMATIVRRTFLNRHRRHEPVVPLADDEPETSLAAPHDAERSGPEQRLLARRLAHELKGALDELPEAQRLAVFLVDVQGYGYAEAATALGMPAGTVASRVARGRARIRERLRHLARERGWTP